MQMRCKCFVFRWQPVSANNSRPLTDVKKKNIQQIFALMQMISLYHMWNVTDCLFLS